MYRIKQKTFMDKSFGHILIIQTAFIGDAILTLPMIQVLKNNYPQSSIDVVAVPRSVEIFSNHPAISRIIPYDKRGRDRGFRGFWRLQNTLSAQKYDLIVIPHRSLRSALLGWTLRPAILLGFDRSAGRILFTKTERYNPALHEIERNLSLLASLKIQLDKNELPHVYPSDEDKHVVDSLFESFGTRSGNQFIAIAPGTIWNTKRWPADRFSALCKQLVSECSALVLLGGKEDKVLCQEIAQTVDTKNILNVAGKLSLLQAAEMIRRCCVLISNDSAPMHLAVAVGTPVLAIFGATVPEFGFAPRGKHDIVLEKHGLRCRPCSIHGGDVCPIGTFDCMMAITPEFVAGTAKSFLQKIKM
jgi:heptosyltransferase II